MTQLIGVFTKVGFLKYSRGFIWSLCYRKFWSTETSQVPRTFYSNNSFDNIRAMLFFLCYLQSTLKSCMKKISKLIASNESWHCSLWNTVCTIYKTIFQGHLSFVVSGCGYTISQTLRVHLKSEHHLVLVDFSTVLIKYSCFTGDDDHWSKI